MNQQIDYTLTSRYATGPLTRQWGALAKGALALTSLLAETAAIVIMSYLSGTIYHIIAYGERGDTSNFLNLGILAAGIFAIPNLIRGEYKVTSFFEFEPHLRRAFFAWNITLVALLAIGFLTKIAIVYSRGWALLFYLTTIPVLLLLRYLIVKATISAQSAGLIAARRVYLIGSGNEIGAFISRYQPWSIGICVAGCRFLTPIRRDASHTERLDSLDRDLGEAVENVRYLEPDAIFLVLPWSETETIDRCAERFLSLPVEIHLAPEQIVQKFKRVQLSTRGNMPSLQLTRLPLSNLEILAKRAFDLAVAGIAVALLTPILLLIAMVIKLDSTGPVFFVQRRYGFNQRQFRIIKFRTMTTADDGDEIRQATQGDPRVTRMGRWLRRWNIDEVPQLFNVLLGDMSLVGPRPHALTHDHEYERKISLYARRHNVKPGITGWAQVNGFRGETDDERMRRRVEHDLFYIDNWSLWLDIFILIRTVVSPSAYQNAF